MIEYGNPGKFASGDEKGQPEAGNFSVGIESVSCEGNYAAMESAIKADPNAQVFVAEKGQKGGTGQYVTQATLRNDAVIVLDKNTITARDKIHEIGHADEAARDPVQYVKDSQPDKQVGPHDKQPAEIYANHYADQNKKDIH